MILVDTNVLSEIARPVPEGRVVTWLAAQDQMVVSAVTVGELRRGMLALPEGRRRTDLLRQVDASFAEHVERILPYTAGAARIYAHLHARRRSQGRPLALEDGMIAATALLHSAAVATRNVSDFEDLGLELVNPWDQQPSAT